MRNKQIDGLRGIAAVIIVVFHLICRYLQIYEQSDIILMRNWGGFGVIIFLIISGFFLFTSSEKILSSTDGFRYFKYLRGKISRLWPSYIVSITITAFVVHVCGLVGRESTWRDWFLNAFFINGFIGTPYVDAAHWYMTTLIAITVIFGFFVLCKIHNSVVPYVVWMLLVTCLVLLGKSGYAGILGGTYLSAAVLGFALYVFSHNYQQKKWILLAVIAIICTVITRGVEVGGEIVIALIVVYGAMKQKLSFLEYKLFQFLGKISYPLYLIHQNIGYVIINSLKNNAGGEYKLYYSIIAMVIVIGLAVILFYLVEKQATHFVRFIEKIFFSQVKKKGKIYETTKCDIKK